MHGKVKVRTTLEQEALKKKERIEKLARYRAGINIVFQKRRDKIYDNELMIVTEQMLLKNPDIYTLWNIRREAFLNNDWDEELNEEYYSRELTLTENCLKENPKSYYIWHQRSWVLDHMKKPNWQKELTLCAKCLQLDDRNFHCWDYRQFLVRKAGIPATEEFDFSTSKINNNFSNYSSWHYRNLLLSKIFLESDDQIMKNIKRDELELVMNATFTDPDDSSAWIYQRWLLDTCKQLPILSRALITKHIAILSFNQAVSISSVTLVMDNKQIESSSRIMSTEWKSPHGTKFSELWFNNFTVPLTEFKEVTKFCMEINEKLYPLIYSESQKAWMYKSQKENDDNYIHDQLCEQLSSYKQLAKMEPNNKWALLTGVLLMKKINLIHYKKNILQNFKSLIQIDPLRINYYNDLRSKYIVEFMLYELWNSESNTEMKTTIDLSGLNLTTLNHEQHFSVFEEVNLAANFLQNVLHRLSFLQSCRKLSISSNQLETLQNFPCLPNLQVLFLRNNNLQNVDDVIDLVKKHKLMKLDLRDNPISTVDLQNSISLLNLNLELIVN